MVNNHHAYLLMNMIMNDVVYDAFVKRCPGLHVYLSISFKLMHRLIKLNLRSLPVIFNITATKRQCSSSRSDSSDCHARNMNRRLHVASA